MQLASESEKVLNEIAKILGDLDQGLALFEIYSQGLELEPSLLQALFDILVELVLCSVAAIKHFRKNDIHNATVILSWNTIRSSFAAIIQEISTKVNHLKELVEAKNAKESHSLLLAQLGQMRIAAPNQQAEVVLPCLTLPFQRNPLFYARKEILEQVSRTLQKPDQTLSIRSVALWGLGGVGKSQIALEFAHQQFAAGCQIVLWIPSETESEVASAYNKAANQLQVPGVLPTNTPDQNRYLVNQFLQSTRKLKPSACDIPIITNPHCSQVSNGLWCLTMLRIKIY